MTAPLPNSIGSYQILSLLGQGGMGMVYAGEEKRSGTPVAIKVLKTQEKGLRQRFLREAQILSQLNHPQIVKVLDYGVENDEPYMVMAYLQGPTLKDILAQKAPLHLREAISLFTSLVRAVDYAHSQGVMHRDIKPENVIFVRDRLVLMDFGLAHQGDLETITQTGEVIGSPAYMAPEQIRDGLKKVDHRTDLYALGVILYEMLTGQRPFGGDNHYELVYKVTHTPPPLLSSLKSDFSESWDAICQKALAKDPQNRYDSARAFLLDVKKAAQGEEISLKEETDTTRDLDPEVTHASPIDASPLPRPSPLPFQFASAKVIAPLLALFLLGTVFFYWNFQERDSQRAYSKEDLPQTRKEERRRLLPLVEGINSDRQIEERVEKILQKRNPHTAPVLLEYLQHSDSRKRLAALTALSRLEDRSSSFQGKNAVDLSLEWMEKLSPVKDKKSLERLLKLLQKFPDPRPSLLQKHLEKWRKAEELFVSGQWLTLSYEIEEVKKKLPFWSPVDFLHLWSLLWQEKLKGARRLFEERKKLAITQYRWKIGQIYLNLLERKHQALLHQLEDFSKEEKSHPLYHYLLYSYYRQYKNEERLWNHIEKALEKAPRHWTFLKISIEVCRMLEKRNLGLNRVEEALQIYPQSGVFLALRAEILWHLQKKELFQNAAQKALKALARERKKYPQSLDLQEVTVKTLMRKGDYQRVLSLTSKWLARAPSILHRASSLRFRARALHKMGRFRQALKYYQKSSSLCRPRKEGHSKFFSIYYSSIYYQARLLIKGAVVGKRRKENPSVVQKRFDEAYALMEECIKANSYREGAYFWLGKIAWYQNRLEKAIEVYEKMLEIYPRKVGGARALANLYLQTGKRAKFNEITRGASRRFGYIFGAYQLECLGLRYRGEYARIVQLCTEALTKYPGFHYFHLYRGDAHLKLGHYDRAQVDLLKVKLESKKRSWVRRAEEGLEKIKKRREEK